MRKLLSVFAVVIALAIPATAQASKHHPVTHHAAPVARHHSVVEPDAYWGSKPDAYWGSKPELESS